MHPNIAQLSRWWVAKSIITDSFDPAPLNLSSISPTHSPPVSLIREAAPYDLYPEEGDQLPHHTGNFLVSSTPQDSYSQLSGPDTQNHSSSNVPDIIMRHRTFLHQDNDTNTLNAGNEKISQVLH